MNRTKKYGVSQGFRPKMQDNYFRFTFETSFFDITGNKISKLLVLFSKTKKKQCHLQPLSSSTVEAA